MRRGIRLRVELSDVDERLESNLLSAIVDLLDDGLIVVSDAGRVLLVNRAYREQTALPRVEAGDMLLTAFRADTAPELREVFARVLRGDIAQGAWDTPLGRGRRLLVSVHALAANGVVLVRVVFRNETETSALVSGGGSERQAELEAFERAASGLTHDFNNLLTAVLGSTVSLRGLLERALDDTWSIDRAAAHASVLSRRLRSLTRNDSRELAAIDVHALVQELLPMLSAAAGAAVRIQLVPSEQPWLVEADAVELEQVLMNLVINARDAIIGETGSAELPLDAPRARRDSGITTATHGAHANTRMAGSIEIRVQNLSADDAFARLRDRSERVAIHVRDSGHGIPAEYVARVFDPFFTTKAPGRGTGLGLTNVREIVERSQGQVSIQSEPGRGTTVSVFLPRCTTRHSVRALPTSFLRGSEVVLVVEDDYRVRITTARALSERGYKVLTASTADEARRIEREYEGTIHLLLTDVGLAGVSGIDLASELCKRRPELQVLFVSGHAEDVALGRGASEHGLLLKPYRPDELATRVRDLLDAAAEARVAARVLGA